jgi:hypothetical protein
MIEFSDDNSTFYQLTKGTWTSPVDAPVVAWIKLSATGKYYINVNNEFFNGGVFKTRYIRVSASASGTTTNSLLAITAVLGVG